jgi:outer membrane protein OmpA-like peptidoglycan-associated protein
MLRSSLWPALALLGLLAACQRQAAAPTDTSTGAQTQAEVQTQAKDTPARPGDAARGGDAEGLDLEATELQPLIERVGGRLRAQDILVTLEPDTVFEPERADLRVDAISRYLRPLADLANRTRGPLQITAYADPGGDRTEALALSKRRADAVADFLQSQGVAPDRLHTSGMGAAAAGSARIEIVLPRPGA